MFSNGYPSVNKKEYIQNVDEESIASTYLKVDKLPCVICSPLRKDNKPSFGLFKNNLGKVHYFDFANRDHGSIYDLLMKLWNLSFSETIDKIISEDNSRTYTIPKTLTSVLNNKGYKMELGCKKRDWKKYDEEYWNSYGIPIKWCIFGNIYPISYIFVTKRGKEYVIPAEKYAYVYLEWKDLIPTYKIYQPFSKDHKWSNNRDSSVWDLWTKIPKTGDKLIITSSRKDALCIWANTGIPSVSLMSEGTIPKKKVVAELKERFKKIYVLFDNDYSSSENHGHIFGMNMAEKFDLIQIEIPDIFKSKDPSDLYKNHGKEVLIQTILELTKDDNR